MQMMITAMKTLQPRSEKGRCRYVVPVIHSLCVNNRCQTENNNISRHLWVKYEYRQLGMNVSQKILTKIHCIISV